MTKNVLAYFLLGQSNRILKEFSKLKFYKVM